MSEILLTAVKRETGRHAARELRQKGHVPGVYYANNQEPVHFSVPVLSLRSIVYTSEAKVVRLEVDGAKGLPCILKDIAFHPITDAILHFDLLGVSAGRKINVEIPLHFTGQSIGIRNGGVVDQVIHKANVLVDPTNMPTHIDVDITNLDVNESLNIGDIKVDGVEFTDRPDRVVVTCVPHRAAGDAPATDTLEESTETKAE